MTHYQTGHNMRLTSATLSTMGAPLGTIAYSPDGLRRYRLIQASELLNLGKALAYDRAANTAALMTHTTADPELYAGLTLSRRVAVPAVEIAASAYGWIQFLGPALIEVEANTAQAVKLYSSATAGQLTATQGSDGVLISGCRLTAARGNTAGVGSAILNFGRIRNFDRFPDGYLSGSVRPDGTFTPDP